MKIAMISLVILLMSCNTMPVRVACPPEDIIVPIFIEGRPIPLNIPKGAIDKYLEELHRAEDVPKEIVRR